MEWANGVENDPVFPEFTEDGPTKKTKNENAWSTQCSEWAKRDGFELGMGLHAPRREVIIKADDGRAHGQLMKFCGHKNEKTITGHYLDDMSNVDGAAVYLGLEQRQDITQDFRSASMKRNPGLQHSLPSRELDELKHRQDFVDLREQIEVLSLQLNGAITEEASRRLQAQRRRLYDQQQNLVRIELAKYRENQQKSRTTQCEEINTDERHRTYFDRVVRHMVPERDRLSHTLEVVAPLRSKDGISALQDLIALRTNDSRVAYQEVLRPVDGRCPVPTCGLSIKDIASKDTRARWAHVYRCSKRNNQKQFGFAEFCFLCSKWITSKVDWEAHCQVHIDNLDIPSRCGPVIFRSAVACPGYCMGCITSENMVTSVRASATVPRTTKVAKTHL